MVPSPMMHVAPPSPMMQMAPPSPALHQVQKSPVSMMGAGSNMAAATCAAVAAAIFPAVEDVVLVRMGEEVLPACLIKYDGPTVIVRPLQAYHPRNMRNTIKWRKNPKGARANYVINSCGIVSGAFHLNDGMLPADIDKMVTTELGPPDQENLKPQLANVPPMPLIPEMPASSSFSPMPVVTTTNKTSDILFQPQAPTREFQFGKELKELRKLGFNQESRLRDVLSNTSGSLEQSVQQLNARRRFKYPTALADIKQMGFSNDEIIKALLMKHHGKKEDVVFEMLG
eukprot:gnl/MRDRNA2_/MRDRNA2_113225_c0_seq1.p1 gnl/MRDRNA2_/MRDRNA2_113225_c0~~gnl/MRDRNA2_/MRDRNA2_113225_c0_seq1.p1  ORF type:complete len:294 (-),score=58.66 gnl/MRDRNA2_/MRDRNA2_113225_c0_seq1:72-926(-)